MVVYLKDNSLLSVGVETLLLYLEPIRSNRQPREDIASIVVGYHVVYYSALRLDHCHRCAGNHRSTAVGYLSCYLCHVHLLRQSCRCCCQQTREQCKYDLGPCVTHLVVSFATGALKRTILHLCECSVVYPRLKNTVNPAGGTAVYFTLQNRD